MPDIFDLISRWWKQVVLVIFLSMLAVGIVIYTRPSQYLSTATAVPTTSYASDKSKIFNQNLQTLYSELGTADDLDMILGVAQLDTVYLSVSDSFNLYDHYKIKGTQQEKRIQSSWRLRKNSRVIKSDYGELKIKVWDTDKQLAAQLANAIMHVVQEIQSDARNSGNRNILIALKNGRQKLLLHSDSLTGNGPGQTDPNPQVARYDQLINEYSLMVESRTPALVIIEEARPSLYPSRPRRMQVMLATFGLSFLFSLLAALSLDKRKQAV
jgi:uncharacterized protein involved in exopolysaccharide biosynthesis